MTSTILGVGWAPVLLAGALALVVAYASRLLPKGTWTGRRGLSSGTATRSLVSVGFFGAETYLPLSLVEHRGLSLAPAGLLLTGATVVRFSGSWLAANVSALASKALRVRRGAW